MYIVESLRTCRCIALLEARPSAEIVEQFPIVPLRVCRLNKIRVCGQDKNIDA